MIPVFQQRLDHRPQDGVWGDCTRACLASIFELELLDVPHLAEAPDYHAALLAWCRERGVVPLPWLVAAADLERVQTSLREGSVDAHHLMGGVAYDGSRHHVVGRYGSVVHDPAPEGAYGRGRLWPDPGLVEGGGFDLTFFAKR